MNSLHKYFHRWTPRLAVLAMLVLVSCALSVTALAADGLAMSTDYPGVTAKAGDALSFSLDFANGGEGTAVALSILALPDGWEGYFLGSGKQISHVYVQEGSMQNAASFELEIPVQAAEGSYEVTLQAEGGGMRSVLTLTLNVQAEELGSSALTTQYAQQEGSSSTSFTFNSAIQNNTPNEQSYSLSAEAPSGWTVAFKADNTQVAAVTVDARGSQSVSVEVTPVANAEAGEYRIPITAISGTETLTGELTVVITGTYDVSISTPSGRLSFDATANKASSVTLNVTNNGNVDLQNLNLSSSAPSGWTVEFSQSTIDVLQAGATVEVTAYVTPSEEALSGDYMATLSIRNSSSSDSAEFRITVKTETTWGIVGILLIVVAAGGLLLVFRKYGRR